MNSIAISPGYAESSVQVFGHQFKPSFVHQNTPIVFILDEDPSLRDSLQRLVRQKGWRSEPFESAEELLAFPRAVVPSCLILDASLRFPSALELQKRFASERPDMPIILIAGKVDIPTTVRAMKAGAVELFTKPFPEDALLSSVGEALERSRVQLAQETEMQALRDRYCSLSRREREVMVRVASGLLNKQVGGELGISEITVKAHRGQVMQKMKAQSLPDLVRFAEKLRLEDRV
jgi:FixJ family two-component response regulator